MQVTIIGCGVIGSALARHFALSHSVTLYNRTFQRAQTLAEAITAKASSNLEEALDRAELILLAVKPQDLSSLAPLLAPLLKPSQLLISTLAGTPLSTLRDCFPTGELLRLMPNTAMLYGNGLLGFSEEHPLPEMRKSEINALFGALGHITWIPETKMTAFAALTASNPAYILTYIEAMIEAGIYMGFRAQEAKELLIHTIEGTLTLLKASGKHPGELKWEITSPQGTTIEGLLELNRLATSFGIQKAILATYTKTLI